MIRFFPYIPTVVHPRRLRPIDDWDGLALLLHPEEVDSWAEEVEMEATSEGSATMLAIHGGGHLSRMLIRMQFLEEINAAKFPDPEPFRLVNTALKGGTPTFFAEPGADDEEWVAWLERVADEATTKKRMFLNLFARGRFKRMWKQVQPVVSEPPVQECGDALAIAAGLAATWWRCSENEMSDDSKRARDNRLASRLRGALAELRSTEPSATLLVPIYQDWLNEMLATLKRGCEVERIPPIGEGE